MGRFDVKNEEKAPLDTKKRGKVLGSGNTVRREAFYGTGEAQNMLQVKFDCREGNEGGQLLECLRLTTVYLSTNIEGSGDAKTSIRNGKLFEPEWPDPVEPNPAATRAMLQAEYGTRAKRAEKLRINLSTAYGLVLGQCTDYLRSRIKRHDQWETTSNDWDLLGLLKSVKSLSQRYDEDTEYHHISYHTLLRRFMLFCQEDYSKL